jgi:DNA processing protein
MFIKDNWMVKDVLLLTYFKNITFDVIDRAVATHNSLNDAIDSGFLQKNIKNLLVEDLFSNQIDEFSDKVDEQLDLCHNSQTNIISIYDENYPYLLKEIPYPPVLLFVKGNKNLNQFKNISIVGTRNNSQYGKLVTEKFVEEFVKYDLSIISGLARGIDSHAHLTALRNNGNTVAVIASGIDKVSPQISAKLAEDMVEKGGSIVSEYKCGVSAKQGYFPQRNRIISGMSSTTLVVESDTKGGSLITARFAFNQNRDVYAVPGNINSTKSHGTNRLIRENIAQIALNPSDIIKSLGIDLIKQENLFAEKQKLELSEEENIVLNLISSEEIQIDEIINKSNLDSPTVMVKLLELEYKGFIKQLPGKHYIKTF